MKHLVAGTAGHIDHGKTVLVKALTGIDTDRLPEEKRRGISIALGYAWLDLPDGTRVGLVDVPGHERFVRTMVAGATGIDLALLVVAADDSVMPQTREHVEILDLLGVSRCVVAVTKCDLVDGEMADLVAEEVAELLEGTTLANGPIVRVSSTTGAGLEELRHALQTTAADVVARRRQGPFRLAVDRVFTIQGRGTVVTGSVFQGEVAAGDALELWPAGRTCRVRGLQTHGRSSEDVHAGQRAAINLIGVDRDEIERGCELATPGYLRPTSILDVQIRCLASAPRPIRSRSRVRLCLGTREALARVVTPDGAPLQPGDRSYLQLRLSAPVTAVFGQRFIVRDETASRTLGGGTVVRCSPVRRRIRGAQAVEQLERLQTGDPADRVEEVLRFAGFGSLSHLHIAAEAGILPEDAPAVLEDLGKRKRRVAVEPGGPQVVASALEAIVQRAARWLERAHQLQPDEPGVRLDAFVGYLDRKSKRGLGRALLDRMVRARLIKVQSRYVAHAAYAPALSQQDERILAAMLGEYEAADLQPPAPDGLLIARTANPQRIDKLIKIAVSTRQLIEVGGKLYLHPAAEERLRQVVREVIHEGADASVSAIRERLQSTRKYVVPYMEYLDRIGFTRRVGDQRVLCESEET